MYQLQNDETWKACRITINNDSDKMTSFQSVAYENVISHFLPAKFPTSVAEGYGRFAGLSFCASVAGSAAMVLSTQTLLLAVGIVGQQQSASIMAGALNWVLKDGIGQLGGVWFASYMGRSTSQFDANPKYWRMMAAIALDIAAFLEICSPLLSAGWVLPMASIANVGKNIGFLTASASRAALHQSLALSGNLADVTAKAASQALGASLFGTAIGIGLSPVLDDVPHFAMGFFCLSIVHQTCNYWSLKSVPLGHFNRHRLHLVLDEYLSTGRTLAPSEVAAREIFLPFLSPGPSEKWLAIGSSIHDVGGPEALASTAREDLPYVLIQHQGRWNVLFQQRAEAQDMLQGMFNVYCLRYNVDKVKEFQLFYGSLQQSGWRLDTEVTRIEPVKAVRIEITVISKDP
jgi:hypothetical protein